MLRASVKPVVLSVLSLSLVSWATAQWELPSGFTKPELIEISQEVLAKPDIPITVHEVFYWQSNYPVVDGHATLWINRVVVCDVEFVYEINYFSRIVPYSYSDKCYWFVFVFPIYLR